MTLAQLQAHFRITLPQRRFGTLQGDWRPLTKQPVGEIHGLPGLRGRLIATNGVIAILANFHTGTVAFVHEANFVRDNLNGNEARPAVSRMPKARRTQLDDYV